MIKRRSGRSRNLTAKTKRYAAGLLIVLITLGGLALYLLWPTAEPPNNSGPQGSPAAEDQLPTEVVPAGVFNKQAHSLNDPVSLWVIVNKGRQLPSSYQPPDLVVPAVTLRNTSGSEMQLRQTAADDLKKMFDTAASEEIKLMVASGWRSYSLQRAIYDRHVKDYGIAEADRVSARPGHSEHQSGWAVDVAPASGRCVIEKCFAEMAEGRWVAANAARFGFIIRYKNGQEQLTGYDYEPWHLRYVGAELAAELSKGTETLEQFFGLPAHSSYPASVYQLK